MSLDSDVKDYLFGRQKVPEGKHLVLCQICGIFAPKKVIYDGSIESVLCDKCLERSRSDGLAYTQCRKCGRFLGFYKTGRVKLDSGVIVEIEPGDTLHTLWCSYCNPAEPSADIEEFKTIMLQKHLEAPKEAIVERGKELKVEGL